jgi:hypothetical protein
MPRVQRAEEPARPRDVGFAMNRSLLLILCMATTVIVPGEEPPEYETGPVEHRVVLGPDEDGDLLVSIKVPVTNLSDEVIFVNLELQARDSEGFQVFEFDLAGKVGARTTEIVTDTEYIAAEIVDAISSWNIK